MNHLITAEQATNLKLHLAGNFTFNLIEYIEDLPQTQLRQDVLATLAFSADGYISANLNKVLTSIYNDERAGEQVNFETYTEFLDYIRGQDFADWMANDAQGVEHTRQTLQALVDIRQAMHAVIAIARPKYVVPEIADMLRNPRARSASADTLIKMEDLAKEIAAGDINFEQELQKQFSAKHRAQALMRQQWDRQRGAVTSLLFNAFNLRLDAGDEEPFMKLNAPTQLGLIRSASKAVDRCIERAMDDNRITQIEFAKLRVEARSIKTTLTDIQSHTRFDDLT